MNHPSGEYRYFPGITLRVIGKRNDLAILWFPNLTVANQVPSAGEPYGFIETRPTVELETFEMPENGTLLQPQVLSDVNNPWLTLGMYLLCGFSRFRAGEPLDRLHRQPVATNENNPGTVNFNWAGATVPGGGYRIESGGGI